jgi:hydrogenase maturation protease
MNEWEWQLLEDKNVLEEIAIQGALVRRGDHVRLRPRAGGDVFDLALSGKIATIESLEQDYEGKVHVCVVVDDDPGRDIGMLRQPGHRFFFAPEELELLPPAVVEERAAAPAAKKILIAGIGNIFLGDDGFGVEVAQRLEKCNFPAGVCVKDFGIRGFDLAYALMEGFETTILIDAVPGDTEPGTVSLIEPDLAALNAPNAQGTFVDAHSMNPVSVLRMAADMGAQLRRVLLVGCLPATLGPEEGQMGLSEPVTAAIPEAVSLVEGLVARILRGEWPGAECL